MIKFLTSKVSIILAIVLFCSVGIYLINVFSISKWNKLTEDSHSHAPAFLSIVFSDSKTGIAITSSEIKQTTDSGRTWKTIYKNEDMVFDALTFSNKQNGWVIGSMKKTPIILKTEDEGLHWQKLNLDEKSLNEKFTRFYDICFDNSGNSWLVGNGGIVKAKIDRENFQFSDITLTKETLFSVSCSDSGEVWAVGEDGAVFHYQNDWTRETISDTRLLTKVKVINNEVWIMGGLYSEGILLKSQNNGKTWENKTPTSAHALFDIYLKENQGWLIGAEGSIYYSRDTGNTWTKSKSPTKNDLLKIFFIDSNDGWISGDKTTILKYQN